MRVLVAMSGGVDSSVAAALLVEQGHDVVGATMILWADAGEEGCCSATEVDDARRVCDHLGVDHHVFNFGEDFEAAVVQPYVDAHAAGRTPNPCLACNRHLKFDRFVVRARHLGFDAVATGHYARVVRVGPDDTAVGHYQLRRGVDAAKDQSYVLAVLDQEKLAQVVLPLGGLVKAEVRTKAAELGLRTATKPDSQDVCFITTAGGRDAFLRHRLTLHPGRVVEAETGRALGTVAALELVTVGQRRGMGTGGVGGRRYALAVDVAAGTVAVGSLADLTVDRVALGELTWVDDAVPPATAVGAQCSAHGEAHPAVFDGAGVVFDLPQRNVAPGQTVALYDGDQVLGAGVALPTPLPST